VKNEKINDKIIYSAILIISLYGIILSMNHPLVWEMIALIILPISYLGIIRIGDLKIRSITTKILSIIYGLVSAYIFVVCIISGFVENGTANIAMKNIGENSPLIVGFLILSIFVYKKIKVIDEKGI